MNVEMFKSVLFLCHVFAHLHTIFAGVLQTHKQLRPTRIRDDEYEGLLFLCSPDEEGLGWEFTICDLIESEFEARSDNFPDKSAKIEFLKELIADIEECVEKVDEERIV